MIIKDQSDSQWLPRIYADKVRTQRTRSVEMDIPERENAADILYTLLGIELKVGNLRIACPDLATARYLRIFARIGCRQIAVPYNITKISVLADELETAWQKTLLMLASEPPRKRSALIKLMRTELNNAGAGEAVPEFRQTTKQRKS